MNYDIDNLYIRRTIEILISIKLSNKRNIKQNKFLNNTRNPNHISYINPPSWKKMRPQVSVESYSSSSE